MDTSNNDFKSAEAFYSDILANLNTKPSNEVIEDLQRLSESYPEFALAHNDLGVLYYGSGNKEKALECYDRAVQLDPENSNFSKNLADFYFVEMGKIEEALQIYVKILELNPQDIETLLNTGHICVSLNNFEEAKVFYQRVLELEPQNEAARSYIDKLDKMKPNDPEIQSPEELYQEIQPLLNNGDPHMAISRLEKLLQNYPDFALAHNDLGVLYYHTGDKERALHYYERAVELVPDNINFQKNLADFLFVEQGKVEKALHIYVNILATHPADVETLLITGHICVTLKKFDDAKEFYKQVLVLAPGNEDASKNLQALKNRQFERSPAKLNSLKDVNVSSVKNEPADLYAKESDNRDIEHKTVVSIVVPLDGIENRLKECLKSIQEHTVEPHEVFLVDCRASKGMLQLAHQLIKDKNNFRIIECGRSAGWARSLNQAIKKASGDMIVLMHNDVVVSEGWLESFKMCMRLEPNTGFLGPISNRAAFNQQLIDPEESSRVDFETDAKAFYEQNQYRRVPVRILSDFCIAFRRELLDKIGYFDEQFVSAEVAVEDICLRASSEGYQNLIVADNYAYHYDWHKTNKSESFTNELSIEDKKRLSKKLNIGEVQSLSNKHLQVPHILTTANALRDKGELDQDIGILLGGIGIQPEDYRLYLALAEILMSVKRFQEAKDALCEMPLYEESQLMSNQIGGTRLNAVVNSYLFSANSAHDYEVKKNTLMAYIEEGLGKFETALNHIERVLSINQKSAKALNLKGILAHHNHERKSAINFFQRAIELDPGYGEPYSNLGIIRLVDKQEEGFKLIEKGFILAPSDFDVATNYHSLITGSNGFLKAEKLVREALTLYPENQKLRYMRIDCLIQLCKYHEAIDEIEAAIVKFGTEDGILKAALMVRERLGDAQIIENSGSPAVSLCMIVKNEEKDIARCLSSVKPIVDEMVVIDTGSSDSTKDIAKAFGAKVYDFDWGDDFAEARNYSISMAEGDWIFVMDADEAISPNDYNYFRQIVGQRPNTAIAYSITTRNYNSLANMLGWTPNDGQYPREEAASGWLPSTKVRLFYGKNQVWFEGAVHEMVDPVLKRNGIKVKQCSIPIHHYGRLKKENVNLKDEVYFEIGKKKLEDTPNDINAIRELAVQATNMGKNREALKLWEELLSLNPYPRLAAETYINVGTIYSRLGNYKDALGAAEKAIENAPDLKEARYNFAMAEFHSGDLYKTINVLENLLSEIPDYPPARFILAAAYCCGGDNEKGITALKELKATSLGPYLVYSCAELAKGLIAAQKHEYALMVLSAAIECEIINTEILNQFAECKRLSEQKLNVFDNSRPISSFNALIQT